MSDSNLLYRNNYVNKNISIDDEIDANIRNTKIIPGTNQYMNRQLNNRILKSLHINQKDGDSMLLNNILDKKENENNHLYSEKKVKISIDSKDRNIYPKNILGETISTLKKNPLTFNKNSNILKIYHKNHNFSVDDKIIIQNIISKYIILKGKFEFINGDPYMKILHENHGITLDYNKFSEFEIKISGIKGNKNKDSYLNNIPISFINKKHNLKLVKIVGDDLNENYYFIKLNKTPTFDYNDSENLNNTIKIIYNNLGGINLNLLNASYPISIDQIKGYHIIDSIIDENNYQIKIDGVFYRDSFLNGEGGNNIIVSKVVESIVGYPNPNIYRIKLKKKLFNVKKMKLISTEFPNTEKVIRDHPNNRRNNKLYWVVLKDGDKIYDISITPGNYNVSTLEKEIQNKINLVYRENDVNETINTNDGNSNLEVDLYHSSDVNIDMSTDVVEIKMYENIYLVKAFSSIAADTHPSDDGHVRLNINHKFHNLEVGDEILISNSLTFNKIPVNIINKSHLIEEIIDDNNYRIRLDLFTETKDNNSLGGDNIKITAPLRFRMYFDRKDTLGELLGFRHTGNNFAITPFDTKVANNIAYENDFIYDSVGNVIVNTNDYVQNNNISAFLGDNYFLMTCNLCSKTNSFVSNNVDNVLAKIMLESEPGDIVYNSFVQLNEEFESQIPSISELEFAFYTPDGELIDFYGKDHSFTLEMEEDYMQLTSTDISATTGLAKHVIKRMK
jgi:hypothetical protein